MPRSTGFLVGEFRGRLAEALSLVQTAEASTTFTHVRRLYIYEAAYLLAFSAWETLLEQSFLRFMCGYRNTAGVLVSTAAYTRQRSVADAYTELLRVSPRAPAFLLWHSPHFVIPRSQLCFVTGPHETVIASARQDIADFAAVRHHVAHRSEDTEAKLQAAALRLSGAQIPGGRAGRFLKACV